LILFTNNDSDDLAVLGITLMSTEKKVIGTGKKMTLHWTFYWACTGQKK